MNKQYLNRRDFVKASLLGAVVGPRVLASAMRAPDPPAATRPNIVLIYADDIGYGDLSCYGATGVKTPNVDKLAEQGLMFTRAYASSATCTPSRYSLLTGRYAWRKEGTGILAGDAGLIIDTDRLTLPAMLKNAGYTTGVVGKWHLGLGDGNSEVNWNSKIAPGPLEIGFDHAFIMPATGDRVPCVYMKDRHVVNLDPNDPITVSYDEPIPGQPTGKTHREQLKMDWSHDHNATIVNGISRIGYMSGGKSALWKDEEMADTFVENAVSFIEQNKNGPFALYFCTHDIHVPRVPHPRFVGKTDMGPRGDAIVQFDWSVGRIMETLERLNLAENTLVVLTSDNGPVLNDGYKDGAVKRVGKHKPAGPLRGGKYSIYDAGTREPFIVRWPGHVKTGVSDALISQVDLFASFAALTDQKLSAQDAPDGLNMLEALLGKNETGREHLIEHNISGALGLVKGPWKYIEPHKGPKVAWETGIELGNRPQPQLYNLEKDIAEKHNLAEEYPQRVEEMAALLEKLKKAGRTRSVQ